MACNMFYAISCNKKTAPFQDPHSLWCVHCVLHFLQDGHLAEYLSHKRIVLNLLFQVSLIPVFRKLFSTRNIGWLRSQNRRFQINLFVCMRAVHLAKSSSDPTFNYKKLFLNHWKKVLKPGKKISFQFLLLIFLSQFLNRPEYESRSAKCGSESATLLDCGNEGVRGVGVRLKTYHLRISYNSPNLFVTRRLPHPMQGSA